MARFQEGFSRSGLILVSLSSRGHPGLGPGIPSPDAGHVCSGPVSRAGHILSSGQEWVLDRQPGRVVVSPGPCPHAAPRQSAPAEGREGPRLGSGSQGAPCGDEGGRVVPA
ncbi:unnamed protein product [Rangifer tarandus platyrhynchus]|uniref:Uncharacterized protein n=1 Tax=Rangifer tarandus platyrhynchus TaxID=3082113 RepID=A0AC59ZMM1_RANTA